MEKYLTEQEKFTRQIGDILIDHYKALNTLGDEILTLAKMVKALTKIVKASHK